MKKSLLIIVTILSFSVLFVQCTENGEIRDVKSGEISVKITDAPSDDANILGTYITISDIKIDDLPIRNFVKQTIKISAFRQGNTMLLVNNKVMSSPYTTLSFVLDYETDNSGNSPGCYVFTDDSVKHNLANASQQQTEIIFNRDFEIGINEKKSLVIDFDLRQSIVRNTDTTDVSKYKFAAIDDMKYAVRLIEEDKSGNLFGRVTGNIADDENIYVFAYRKGEYDSSIETHGLGSGNILFANAVTSAKVKTDGSYKLSFLEEGEFEIHLASFTKNADSYSFKSEIDTESNTAGVNLNAVNIEAKNNLELNINL